MRSIRPFTIAIITAKHTQLLLLSILSPLRLTLSLTAICTDICELKKGKGSRLIGSPIAACKGRAAIGLSLPSSAVKGASVRLSWGNPGHARE